MIHSKTGLAMSSKQPRRTVVLAVDDEADVLRFVAAILEHSGYEVATAECAEGALRAIQAGKADLLLTDVMMANGMDGAELALAAKELKPNLPVVFMSGFDDGRVDGYRARHGTATVLEKPFGISTLLSAVEGALQPSSDYTAGE